MNYSERAIGFLPPAAEKAMEQTQKDRLMLLTDKGLGISMVDACCNSLCTGITGGGKTASLGLPCANSLIEAGLAGFMTATKSNFGLKIRSLAKAHNRSQDIVEYGTGPGAARCNLLANMGFEKMRQFFEDMVKAHAGGQTENWIWLLKGIHQAAHCGQLLRFISEKIPGYAPCISLIAQLVNNQALAIELYQFFTDHVYDASREDHELFRSQVDSQRFHILRKSSKDDDDNAQTTEEEQNTWNLQGIRMALQQFMATPGLAEHFSDPAAPGLNMKECLRHRKLVLAQLTTDTGHAGDIITRYLINSWYEAILEIGPVEAGEIRCFTLLDEFQQIADLGENRYSDFRFTSLSREYGVINVHLTQSEAGLHVNCPNTYRVSGFTSNFNQRFFFYSNDSQTMASAASFDPSIHLQDLKPNTMFVAYYDHGRRAHVCGVDSLNRAYAETAALIAENPVEIAAPGEECAKLPGLLDLIHAMRELREKLARYKAEAEKAAREKERAEREARIKAAKTFSADMDAPVHSTLREAAMKEKEENESVSWDVHERRDRTRGRVPEKSRETPEERPSAFALRLKERFPETIVRPGNWDIPVGWQDYVEKAFEIFERTGLRTKITELRLRSGVLKAWNTSVEERSTRESTELLNRLLEHSSSLCMICGAKLPQDKQLPQNEDEVEFDYDASGAISEKALPICPSCLQNAGLNKYFPPSAREAGSEQKNG